MVYSCRYGHALRVVCLMWDNPVELKLVETDQSESFKTMPYGCTGLPVGDHPGSFGFKRQFHTHEGIDLYVPDGHPVHAVEDGASRCYRPIHWRTC